MTQHCFYPRSCPSYSCREDKTQGLNLPARIMSTLPNLAANSSLQTLPNNLKDAGSTTTTSTSAATSPSNKENTAAAAVLAVAKQGRNNIVLSKGDEPKTPPEFELDEERRYACKLCHHTFTRKHNLKSHSLIHTNEKPYKCTHCSSRFRRQYDLRRHIKTHTREKPFVCKTCGKQFARADALLRHANSNSGCSSLDMANNVVIITPSEIDAAASEFTPEIESEANGAPIDETDHVKKKIKTAPSVGNDTRDLIPAVFAEEAAAQDDANFFAQPDAPETSTKAENTTTHNVQLTEALQSVLSSSEIGQRIRTAISTDSQVLNFSVISKLLDEINAHTTSLDSGRQQIELTNHQYLILKTTLETLQKFKMRVRDDKN